MFPGEFQDEEKREGYLSVARTAPRLFLNNEKPILFDEWQDAPKIWGTIRKECDDHPEEVGGYYLTGSTSKDIETPHTGTGRITNLTMYPMTLFETGESNGAISLTKLLEDSTYDIDGVMSTVTLELYRNSIGTDAVGLVMMDEAFNNMDDSRMTGVLPSRI